MNQLPIFVTLKSRKVILVGDGDAADAKRRLIERAGGQCVDADDKEARLAFVALEDAAEAEQVAMVLKAKGLLVNVVDQPGLCDFTTPAIIDRDPVLIAIGTGGASAGLAKALRQRLEILLPAGLGQLALALSAQRERIRQRWTDNVARRKAIDDALSDAGILDPLAENDSDAVDLWLQQDNAPQTDKVISILLSSSDPDALTLRQARLLGQADHIFHDRGIGPTILNRARADAIRHEGNPHEPMPPGLVLHLRLSEEAK